MKTRNLTSVMVGGITVIFFLLNTVSLSCTKEPVVSPVQPGGHDSSVTVPDTSVAKKTDTAAAARYKIVSPVTLTDKHDTSIRAMDISGGTVPAITLINCYNIRIINNRLHSSTDVGIHAIYCKNITVDSNYFYDLVSGCYVEQTKEGGIVVENNQFLNMKGPSPKGQFIQFNNVRGAHSSISFNKGENIFGQGNPEDAISLYQSAGTQQSPVRIKGNWIRGGGPSGSGGGIMLGDKGGSWLSATENVLVNPGMYGMAIAGGDHNLISNNKVYGKKQSFTNVGIYVNSIAGYTESNNTVSDNQVNFFNADNYNNNSWLAPGCEKPVGWDANQWGAKLDDSILPAVVVSMK